VKIKTAAHQQGMIQIVRDFCDHSNAACEHCRFPELVRAAVWLRAGEYSQPLARLHLTQKPLLNSIQRHIVRVIL